MDVPKSGDSELLHQFYTGGVEQEAVGSKNKYGGPENQSLFGPLDSQNVLGHFRIIVLGGNDDVFRKQS